MNDDEEDHPRSSLASSGQPLDVLGGAELADGRAATVGAELADGRAATVSVEPA